MKASAIASVAALAALGTIAAPADLGQLRSECKLVFGVLPDKMPGAEQDTPARIALGKRLYFDIQLSTNQSQSCNTCHRLDENKAGVDNEPTSEGAFDKRGDRNSPTVLNAGFHFAQFWDGRAASLAEQAQGPVLNPVEMAMPSQEEVLRRLKSDREYPKQFSAAFPGVADPLSYANMAEAIAAFERTLKTHDRFDDFQRGNDQALSAAELNGLRVFLDTGCTTCHTSPVMGGNSYQKMGLVNPYANTTDLGRYTVTKEDDDRFKFKVPSLRNVALTWPYFHDGKVAKLDEAVKTMGHLQLGKDLTRAEIDAIVTFLNALSDKERSKS